MPSALALVPGLLCTEQMWRPVRELMSPEIDIVQVGGIRRKLFVSEFQLLRWVSQ
jgi:hypothetical protein